MEQKKAILTGTMDYIYNIWALSLEYKQNFTKHFGSAFD